MEENGINVKRLYSACCLALIVAAMTLSIRGDTIPAIKAEFGFTDYDMGKISGPVQWGFAISILIDVIAERVPRGSALALAVIGSLGVFSAGYIIIPAMGRIQDHYSIQKLEHIAPATLQKVLNEEGTGIDERKVRVLNSRGKATSRGRQQPCSRDGVSRDWNYPDYPDGHFPVHPALLQV
jgi:hypothetical protein